MTFARVELIGHVGRDPEVRYTREGTAVAHLSVATDECWTDREQTTQHRTLWHRVEVWGPLATVIQGHVHKGQRLFVSGTLDYREWTRADGVRARLCVVKLAGPRAFLRLLGSSAAPTAAPVAPLESPRREPFVPDP